MTHPTKNDLPAAKRKKLCMLLTQLLADAVDLHSHAKQAHWNVKGENFIALHELFDKAAAEAENAADTLAERIQQLGESSPGTVRAVAKSSRLKEYPLAAVTGQQHVEALSSSIAGFNVHARKAIDDTAALGDAVTSDTLTGIVSALDKQLWFVESHAKR